MTPDANNGRTNFSVNLVEPFIIDKQSDIFLEHFTVFDNAENGTSNSAAFILSIDQFKIHNFSNNEHLQNSFIIPNEGGGDNMTKTHKAKKLNYVCSINPTKLTTISGTLKLIDGTTKIFHSDGDSDGRFILEFVIIPRNDD